MKLIVIKQTNKIKTNEFLAKIILSLMLLISISGCEIWLYLTPPKKLFQNKSCPGTNVLVWKGVKPILSYTTNSLPLQRCIAFKGKSCEKHIWRTLLDIYNEMDVQKNILYDSEEINNSLQVLTHSDSFKYFVPD